MSYERIVSRVKKIETVLSEMGASGRGLHAKLTSIESQLDGSVVRKIRFIASIRNKLLHEDGFELSDDIFERFEGACDQVEEYFHRLSSETRSSSGRSSSAAKKTGIALTILGVLAFILR